VALQKKHLNKIAEMFHKVSPCNRKVHSVIKAPFVVAEMFNDAGDQTYITLLVLPCKLMSSTFKWCC